MVKPVFLFFIAYACLSPVDCTSCHYCGPDGACHLMSKTPAQETFLSDDAPTWHYTCQCPQGFGMENCTQISATVHQNEICTEDELVTLTSDTEEGLIFIDHAIYGRPKKHRTYEGCKEGAFSQSAEDECYAMHSLVAVTYWCQGKHQCSFHTSLLHQRQNKPKYFLANISETVDSTSAAERVCNSQNAQLAQLVTTEEELEAFDLVRDVGGGRFWIAADDALQCLYIEMTPEKENIHTRTGPTIASVPCSHFPHKNLNVNGIVCQVLWRPKNTAEKECLTGLESKILELRFHRDKISNKEVACPHGANYRREYTCYRKTKAVMDWWEARQMCWSWGGDLAVPLNHESKECQSKIYNPRTEELWLASSLGCMNDTARCAVPLASTEYFIEGTYATKKTNDLCFMATEIDRNCRLHNACSVKRRGLCALPPVKHERTEVTLADLKEVTPEKIANAVQKGPRVCQAPKKISGYTGYEKAWSDGGIGSTVLKPCPEGQKGTARWECDASGSWIGDMPLLDHCTTLDIYQYDSGSDNTTAVNPTELIQHVNRAIDAAGRASLASGDVVAALDITKQALQLQKEQLQFSPEISDSERETSAQLFGSASIKLLDRVMANPVPWLGIGESDKNLKLSRIQESLDEIALDLVKYSSEKVTETHLEEEVITMSVQKGIEVSSTSAISFGSLGSQITIKKGSHEDAESIVNAGVSFKSFSNIGCLLAGRDNCSKDIPSANATVYEYANSPVLGATLYSLGKNGSMAVEEISNAHVQLEFAYHIAMGGKYNLSKPRCVFWNGSLLDWSEAGCTLVQYNSTAAMCECEHLTNFAIIMDINGNLEGKEILNSVLTVITVIGCSLSIVGFIICIAIFGFVKGLRIEHKERCIINVNLCVCLLIAELLLLGGLDATDTPLVCSIIAGLMHYFFLAAFGWMLVEGIHLYIKIVKVFPMESSIVWLYFVLGYACPAVIVGISAAVFELTKIHGYGTDRACWLDHSYGQIWAFAGPVLFVILINIVMFSHAMTKACMAMRRSVSACPDSAIHRNGSAVDVISSSNARTVTLIKGSFSLFCILGLTWLFGFMYFWKGGEALAVVFSLLNAFQGVFILYFHVLMNKSAKGALKRTLRRQLANTRFETLAVFREASSSSRHAGSVRKLRKTSRTTTSSELSLSELPQMSPSIDNDESFRRAANISNDLSTDEDIISTQDSSEHDNNNHKDA